MGTMCHVVRKPCQIQQICKSRLNFQLHFYVENHLKSLKIFLENKFQLENIFCSKPDHFLNLSSENTNILHLTFSFLFFFLFEPYTIKYKFKVIICYAFFKNLSCQHNLYQWKVFLMLSFLYFSTQHSFSKSYHVYICLSIPLLHIQYFTT